MPMHMHAAIRPVAKCHELLLLASTVDNTQPHLLLLPMLLIVLHGHPLY